MILLAGSEGPDVQSDLGLNKFLHGIAQKAFDVYLVWDYWEWNVIFVYGFNPCHAE